MSIVRIALDDIKGPAPAPEGMHDLRIFSAKPSESDNANSPDWNLGIQIEDDVDAAPMYHGVWFHVDPETGQDRNLEPEQKKRCQDGIKSLAEVFGLQWGDQSFDMMDFVGLTGSCRLGVKDFERKDGSPGSKNVLYLPPPKK